MSKSSWLHTVNTPQITLDCALFFYRNFVMWVITCQLTCKHDISIPNNFARLLYRRSLSISEIVWVILRLTKHHNHFMGWFKCEWNCAEVQKWSLNQCTKTSLIMKHTDPRVRGHTRIFLKVGGQYLNISCSVGRQWNTFCTQWKFLTADKFTYRNNIQIPEDFSIINNF